MRLPQVERRWAKKPRSGAIHKEINDQDKVIEEIRSPLAAATASGGVPGWARASSPADRINNRTSSPDLCLDITGRISEEARRRRSSASEGPIFTNILLADEINRTSQDPAALLQAMRPGDRRGYHVLTSPSSATQNPIEQEGTYPLPEAQLDRFMFNIAIDYPPLEQEMEIVAATTSSYQPVLQKVISGEKILEMQDLVRKVPASSHVIGYAVKLLRATRPAGAEALPFVKDWVGVGAGPRASQHGSWRPRPRRS
jgi:MoxR-like ATPase